MVSSLDPRRLLTFRMVAHSGSVSEAARRLHLSQPAVTAQVQQLETALGCPLFLRARGGMVLTDEGRRLAETAEALHRLLGEAEQDLTQPRLERSPLRLGASTTVAAYLLPPLLAAFLQRYPGTSLYLEVGNTDQVQAWLRSGRVDLGLVEGLPHAQGLHLEPFRDDHLVCVGPGHPPSGFRIPRSLPDLDRTPILWRESGSGTRAVVVRALAKLTPPRVPRPSDPVLGQTEALKRAVQAGMGLAFLPRCAIDGELARGELCVIDLPGLRIERRYSWVVPSGGATGSASVFQRMALAWERERMA